MWFRFLLILIVCVEISQGEKSSGNSSNEEKTVAKIVPKQSSVYDDYDLNELKSSGSRVEGSGGAASLDEYADDEEDEQLSRVTASTIRVNLSTTVTSTTTIRSTTTTTTTTTITTTMSTVTTRMTRRTSTTSTSTTAKTTINNEPSKKKLNNNNPPSNFNDLDEFKEDQEEYGDDLEDDAYYNEPTASSKTLPPTAFNSRQPLAPTRNPTNSSNTPQTPLLALFNFLTLPPIASGILAGLAIGILTSLFLLVCIIRRFHKRDKSHSSYTTGLLYPNHYGYSKSPQEFYA